MKGSVPKKAVVSIQARKPAMKQWRKVARARVNGRGLWRAKVRLTAGGWELRASAGRKSTTAQLAVVGRKRKVVLRKGVEELQGSQIKTVSGDPATSQSVVVGAKSLLPKVGDVVVADTSKSAPNGLLGRVTSVDQATLTAAIKPVALDQAYRTYQVSLAARLGHISPRTQGLSAALAGVPLTLKCTKIRGAAVPHFASELDVSSLRASFDMDLANRYISLLVTGHPSVGASVKWEAALKAGCHVRVSVPSIPLGPTGLTLDLSPGIEATLEAAGGASLEQTATARLAVGFVAYKGNVTYAKGASLKVGAPELSAAAKGSLEISLNNEVALMVAGRVGVFGSLGPVIGAELSSDSSDGVCVDVTGALQIALGIKADLFVTDWQVDLAKAKVTLGHLYKKCFSVTSASPAADLLAEINRARSSVQWCGTSRYGPQPPLLLHPQLNVAAQGWAEEMASGRQPFAHIGSDGTGPIDRVLAVGYVPPPDSGVRENIATGQQGAREVVAAWVASPGHCENLMEAVDFLGAGKSGVYWVADFKCPCSGAGASPNQSAIHLLADSSSSESQSGAPRLPSSHAMGESAVERKQSPPGGM